MAYYTPPGGDATARVAAELQRQSLHGLGIVPSVNVRMPRAIPAAMGAARRRFAEQTQSLMTGMGIVTTRIPRATHLPVPTAVTFHAARAFLEPATLTGLGAAVRVAAPSVGAAVGAARGAASAAAIGAARGAGGVVRALDVSQAFPTTAGVHRQAAQFMAPGGGYSQIPGFLPPLRVPLRGLGQSDTSLPSDFFTPSTPVIPPSSTTLTPAPDIFSTAPAAPAPISLPNPTVGLPGGFFTSSSPIIPAAQSVSTAAPSLLPSTQKTQINPLTGAVSIVAAPQANFLQQSMIGGIPNTYLLAGGALVLLLGTMGGKRRRNPRRRRTYRA